MLPPAQDLVRRAARVLQGFDGVKAEAARSGIRPMPVDRHSVVGPIPGVDGYYVVVTHSAVTLAAFLGQAVAEEIAHGRVDVHLTPFRPARFFVA